MQYLNDSINCNIGITPNEISHIFIKSCLIVARDEKSGIVFKVTGNSSEGFKYSVFNKGNRCWNEFYSLVFSNNCMNTVHQENKTSDLIDSCQIRKKIYSDVKQEFIKWVEQIYQTLIFEIMK